MKDETQDIEVSTYKGVNVHNTYWGGEQNMEAKKYKCWLLV